MNKIKRGVSLLLCSLLFGSAVTLGNVADVQAGKQIKTETKQTINNTKTKKKFNHLSRTSAHRKAMLSNMAASLILNKRISTTVPKAKALKIYVEPLITKSKNDNTNSRRVVFSYLGQKEAVTELFSEVAPKIVNRPGGYTRILRTGNRIGDNAETCIIELVDFNATYTEVKQEVKKTTTRRRRSSGAKKAEATGAAVVEEAPKAETPAEEAPKAE